MYTYVCCVCVHVCVCIVLCVYVCCVVLCILYYFTYHESANYWTNLHIQFLLLVVELDLAVVVSLHEKVPKVETGSVRDALLQVLVLPHAASEAAFELLRGREREQNRTHFLRGAWGGHPPKFHSGIEPSIVYMQGALSCHRRVWGVCSHRN